MGFVVNREPQRFKWAFMPWTSRLSMSVPASPPPPAGASADQFRRSGYTLLPGVISPESARCMATYALLQQNWPGYYQPEEMFGAALGRYADALSESLLSALHLPLASRHRRCGRCVWQVRAGTSPWRWRPATCSSTAAPTCPTGANLSRANTGYRPSCTMWTPTARIRIQARRPRARRPLRQAHHATAFSAAGEPWAVQQGGDRGSGCALPLGGGLRFRDCHGQHG